MKSELFLLVVVFVLGSCVKEYTCKCDLLGENGIDPTDGSVIYSLPYGEKMETIKDTKDDAEDACEELNGKTYVTNEEGDITYVIQKNRDLAD